MGVNQRGSEAPDQAAQPQPEPGIEAGAEEVEAMHARPQPGRFGECWRSRLAHQVDLDRQLRADRGDQLQDVGRAPTEAAVGDRLKQDHRSAAGCSAARVWARM